MATCLLHFLCCIPNLELEKQSKFDMGDTKTQLECTEFI